jgi:hypothetical protein
MKDINEQTAILVEILKEHAPERLSSPQLGKFYTAKTGEVIKDASIYRRCQKAIGNNMNVYQTEDYPKKFYYSEHGPQQTTRPRASNGHTPQAPASNGTANGKIPQQVDFLVAKMAEAVKNKNLPEVFAYNGLLTQLQPTLEH